MSGSTVLTVPSPPQIYEDECHCESWRIAWSLDETTTNIEDSAKSGPRDCLPSVKARTRACRDRWHRLLYRVVETNRNMTHADLIREERDLYQEDSAEWVALELLLSRPRGAQNAWPGESWAAEVRGYGFPEVNKNWLQNVIVVPSRKSGRGFVCSCHKGFFIIDSVSDVAPMQDLYVNRIAAEQANLGHYHSMVARIEVNSDPGSLPA